MRLTHLLKSLGQTLGFHVQRNHHNPAYTLMGLRREAFETVLDVGANRGQFAQAMLAEFPDATFHCFEPMPDAFQDLANWARGQSRVIPVQLALGEQVGNVEMNLHLAHDTSSSLLSTTRHGESVYPFVREQASRQVGITTLDHYLDSIPRPIGRAILKIDVQGYETQVLKGAPKALSQILACILEVNIDDLYEGQSKFSDIVRLMTDGGLRYAGNFDQVYGEDGRVIALDALFLRNRSGISSPVAR